MGSPGGSPGARPAGGSAAGLSYRPPQKTTAPAKILPRHVTFDPARLVLSAQSLLIPEMM